MKHWPDLVAHVQILSNDADRKTRQGAENMLSFLTNKNALLTIAFILDLQEILKVESKAYQKKGESVIGQKARRDQLLNRLEELRNNRGGRHVNNLLVNTICQDFQVETTIDEQGTILNRQRIPIGPETGCYTFEKYEGEIVKYHGEE